MLFQYNAKLFPFQNWQVKICAPLTTQSPTPLTENPSYASAGGEIGFSVFYYNMEKNPGREVSLLRTSAKFVQFSTPFSCMHKMWSFTGANFSSAFHLVEIWTDMGSAQNSASQNNPGGFPRFFAGGFLQGVKKWRKNRGHKFYFVRRGPTMEWHNSGHNPSRKKTRFSHNCLAVSRSYLVTRILLDIVVHSLGTITIGSPN